MAQRTDGVPSWLFSFVDLAFLMVIAMTQLASDVNQTNPDLGEMVVPRIDSEASSDLSPGAAEAWQLRVYPRTDDVVEAPFELLMLGVAEPPPAEGYDSVDGLRLRLEELQQAKGERPVLAPHQDSRSQDLLDAAAAIEEYWPGRRRVTVSRIFED